MGLVWDNHKQCGVRVKIVLKYIYNRCNIVRESCQGRDNAGKRWEKRAERRIDK